MCKWIQKYFEKNYVFLSLSDTWEAHNKNLSPECRDEKQMKTLNI